MTQLRKAREAKGWWQYELADRAGVSRAATCRWENGKTPRERDQRKLLKALGMEWAERGLLWPGGQPA